MSNSSVLVMESVQNDLKTESNADVSPHGIVI